MSVASSFPLLYFLGVTVVVLAGAAVAVIVLTYWQTRECMKARSELRKIRAKLKEKRREMQKLLVEIVDANAQLAETERQLSERRAGLKATKD